MKRKTQLIVELDAEELAFRIGQAAIGVKAPPGTTAKEGMALYDAAPRPLGFPPMGQGFRDAAHVALEYFREQMQKGHRPQ